MIKEIGITSKDINNSKYVKFVYDNLNKSWTKLRQKNEEYDKESTKRIIKDFDFSNPILKGIDLSNWMLYYDLKNNAKYTFKENKDFAYHVVLLEKAEYLYSIKDYNRTELLKIYINTPELDFNVKKQLSILPKKAQEYLEMKLSKPFNRKELEKELEKYYNHKNH